MDVIVKLAVPILVFIYPISIALIFLNFMKDHIKNDNVFVGTVIGTGFVSVYEAIGTMYQLPAGLENLYSALPFANIGLAWVLPGIIGGIIFKFIKKK